MELNICHLYPDVLNLYGDRGNIACMKKRLEWRGIGCAVTELPLGTAGRESHRPGAETRRDQTASK